MKSFSPSGRARSRARLFCIALFVAACVGAPRTPPVAEAPPVKSEPPADVEVVAAPPIEREFRGVWVATVGNMDWPSRPGLSVEKQKAELIAILDRAADIGLNAVVFQVRPAADALYDSPYEPWSEYLTGTMGKAPEPYYDPLRMAVREAHRRGLELHAWFNPFRARGPSDRRPASSDHVTRTHPEWVRSYGPQTWMDPSDPAVREQSIRVILDVVRRYDIDGVHIDDYFYPYREYDRKGKLIQFPDDAGYDRYRRAGGEMGRSDWRRNNVDRFIERLYTEVKREKPEVKVGISPFGIWRPGHPAQIEGLDSYEEIFADSRKWLRNGWLDYIAPQLYWPVAQRAQSFPVLLEWWVEQNRMGRHIWAGDYSGRVGNGSKGWPSEEILRQIDATRANPGASGNIHFNMTSLMQSPDGLSERLAKEAYDEPALVPASPWLHSAAPGQPVVTVRASNALGTEIGLAPGDTEEVFLWTVRVRSGSEWATRIVPATERAVRVQGSPEQIVVTAVGKTGNEGPKSVIARRPGEFTWIQVGEGVRELAQSVRP
jgi:uncharacterized lipoprotein YddW (UPF0748 family)